MKMKQNHQTKISAAKRTKKERTGKSPNKKKRDKTKENDKDEVDRSRVKRAKNHKTSYAKEEIKKVKNWCISHMLAGTFVCRIGVDSVISHKRCDFSIVDDTFSSGVGSFDSSCEGRNR